MQADSQVHAQTQAIKREGEGEGNGDINSEVDVGDSHVMAAARGEGSGQEGGSEGLKGVL